MTNPEKRSPAPRANAEDRAETINRVSLVVENPTPRQRWRARVPYYRMAVSSELFAFLVAMSRGVVS